MGWFYDLSTKTKLFIGFGLITTMLSFVALFCLSVAAGSNRGLEETYHRRMSAIDLAQRTQIERVTIARNYRSVMLEKAEDKRAAKMQELEAGTAKFAQLFAELDRSAVDPAERQIVDEMKQLVGEYGPAVKESVRIAAKEPDKAATALAASAKIGLRIAALLEQYVDLTKNATKDLVGDHMADYQSGRRLVIAVLVVSLGLAAWTVTAVGNAIARPMQQAIAVLERVAAGDLTARLTMDRKDEVGVMAKTLNSSLESVRTALSGVAAVLHETSAASTQLAASAHEISGGAQSQAASLEETAASLEEISATVKLNTDNAQEASNIAANARDVAERGGAVVGAAVSAMSEITQSSKQIADIVATIDEIAFQTNLLALNAAVEAARAGEQGRGFAVVATEVRSLAQRTGSAAKEIRGLIAESSAKVEVGTRRVNESGKTLDEIVRSVKRVTDMVAEIAAASTEQNIGVEQVNTAVTQVDQVTQRNAAQTEQLSATASSLSDRSTYLQSLIEAFVLEDRSTKLEMAKKSPPSLPVGETKAHSAPRLVARPRLRKIAGGRRS